jgi:glycine betaine/choline ABC-type transport system substrate-binding protein
MLSRRRALQSLVAVPLLAGAGLAGCKRRGAVRVGSKNFSESVLLGEILTQHLAATTGKGAEHQANLGGSFICHQAMLAGDLDVYVEYTGTALIAILKDAHKPPLTDPAEVRAEVEKRYRDELGILWLPALGFDDSFAILVRKDDADKLGLKTISDLAAVAGKLRPGFGYEFVKRSDGYEAFVEKYGLVFKDAPLTMELGLTYRALAESKVDVIAGNSTSGLIDKLGLVQLADDKRFFPPYEAAPILRKAIADARPDVVTALSALAGRLTTTTMRALNAAIDVEGKSAKEVAKGFLATMK